MRLEWFWCVLGLMLKHNYASSGTYVGNFQVRQKIVQLSGVIDACPSDCWLQEHLIWLLILLRGINLKLVNTGDLDKLEPR